MSRPILAVDIDGVISLFGFDEPPPKEEAQFELVDGMVHCISLPAGARLHAAGRALRPGLGERLGGQSQRLPAEHPRPAGAAAPDLRRRRPLRLRPLEAGTAGRVRPRAGRWPGSTTTSTRAVTSGRAGARSRPCWFRPSRTWASRRSQTEALAAWARGLEAGPSRSTLNAVTGFWPIFFLLVVLKIPVLGAIWLVWWASKPRPSRRDRRGLRRRLQAPAAAEAAARPAPRAARRRRRGAAAALPAGRAHPGGQAGCAACFRSRRISRR